MAGAKPRALVFPDHTADDFDPDVVVTHNDIDYTWNGYGWGSRLQGWWLRRGV